MTLPASPPISLSAICAEFGAPANTPLASFLRGGTYVPNTPANAAVPTALPISLLDLLGAASVAPVNLVDHVISSARGVGIATARYGFNAAGTVGWFLAPSSSGLFPGEWLLSGSASAYEVRVTGALASALTGITNGVWQNAAANWTATVDQAVPGVESEQITVEIRPAGGGTVLATALIDLEAERF